jgi:cysteine-rich repeat protein
MRSGVSRSRCPVLGLVVAALVVAAPGAAHEAREGLATEHARFQVRDGRATLVFAGVSDALRARADEAPAVVGAALLVRGWGADDGRSALLPLEAARWTTRTRRGRTSFVYRDPRGTAGPVRKVVVRDGRLTVTAKGRHFPWMGDERPEMLEVLFQLGREWHCALAPGTQTRRGLRVPSAFAPAGCPALVCGNGARELGEDCDDGNLDDTDTCSNACTANACGTTDFASSWEAIQVRVFERHGCATALCHGAAPGAGGLDLRPEHAYAQLIDAPATVGDDVRVVPGGPKRSLLWKKLAAAVDPTISVPGSPMPSSGQALGADELEAVRLWIAEGAPETGVVDGIGALLGACLPPPTPVAVPPLPAPAPNDGFQLRMPPFLLPAHRETEVCFASYYDLRGRVPADVVDLSGAFVYVAGSELRQDPHSHHLQILHVPLPESDLHHPSLGTWRCRGGAADGTACEPTDVGVCGDGLCATDPVPNIACIGFGPPSGATGRTLVGGAQTAQNHDPGRPGLFARIPIRGVLYWNSHAFNLTDADTHMHAYSNHRFARDRRYEALGFQTLETVFQPAGIAPFTRQVVCNGWTAPFGAKLLFLTSHTHKRGEHFWVDHPNGTRLLDNFDYSDPDAAVFDPPLTLDGTTRRLTYCARYNNGVAADGSPNAATVRRRSTTPSNGVPCQPVACATGRVGAACAGASDHATCDSSPGAGDGLCDACPITAGVTTEDEMFILIGSYAFGDVE